MINTMTNNAAILAYACPGSLVTSADARHGSALSLLSGKARGCVPALSATAAHGGFGASLGFGVSGTGVEAYGVQAQQQAQVLTNEQGWSVTQVDATDLLAPKTAHMGAAKRGVSGPYPWRRPV